MPGAPFGRGAAGGAFPVGAVPGMGDDAGEQAGEGAAGAPPAVRAAGIGLQVRADQAEHGGEADFVRVDAGQRGGPGGQRRDHVVHQEERPGLLAGQGHRLAAQDAPGTPQRLLQMKVGDFYLPALGIQRGDPGGGEPGVVQQRGQHPEDGGLDAAAGGAGGHGELDQPGDRVRQAGRCRVGDVAAALGGHPVRLMKKDQLGAVGQGLERLERHGLRAVLHPPAQVRAGGGEPDPPVHGEEPPVGEVEHAFPQRAGQVIDQGVLPVVVAADRRADPPPGPGADVRDDAELGLGAARGHPERLRQLVVIEQLRRRAIEGGGLHPVPGRPDAQLDVGAGGVQLERPPHHLLPQQGPGLRQRRAGRHPRARLEAQPGQAEGDAQGSVVALAGEQAPGQHAEQGRLRVQRPVQLVAVRRGGHRLLDHPLAQEVLDQAVAVQVLQPVRPQARTGQDPAGQVRPQAGLLLLLGLGLGKNYGPGLRRRHEHGKMAGQRSSCCWTLWLEHLTSYQGLRCFTWHCRARTPHGDQPVADSLPGTGEPDTNRHKSRKLRAVALSTYHPPISPPTADPPTPMRAAHSQMRSIAHHVGIGGADSGQYSS